MKRNVRICLIAAVLVMAVLFTGCDLLQKAQNKMVETSMNVVIDTALDEALSGNEEASEVATYVRRKVTFTVTDSTISGDGITATCLVVAPDMVDFIESYDAGNYASNEEMFDAIKAAIDGAPTIQKEVIIGLKKTENGYEPVNMENFIAAYFGTDDMDMVNNLLDQLK